MQLKELLARVPQVGAVEWIGIRPDKGTPMEALDEVELLVDRGLAGDRKSKRSGGTRQVSLIQAEHLPIIASLAGVDVVTPERLRRNIVVRGINLLALRKARFSLGEAILEGTGHCAPCAKMEAAIGDGGFSAMRGHGGILARVVTGGGIGRGDEVRFIAPLQIATPDL